MDQSHSDAEVDSRLVDIFRDVLQQPGLRLHPDMTPNDVPGWDSISMLTILLAVEQTMGITLRAAQIRRIASVGDLGRLIQNRQD